MFLQGILHVYGELSPHRVRRELANIQLLRELVEDWSVAVLVLFNDGNNQSDQLVPKIYTIQPRAVIVRIPLRFTRISLVLSSVELVAVFKQELVSGFEASRGAILYHRTGPWW